MNVTYVFEPRSATWRTNGKWSNVEWQRRGGSGLYSSAGDLPPDVRATADPIAAADVTPTSPTVTVQAVAFHRHVYLAGYRYGVSERIAGELRAAGHAACVQEVAPPAPPAERQLGGPVRTAAEAELQAQVDDLTARLERIEAKRTRTKEPAT